MCYVELEREADGFSVEVNGTQKDDSCNPCLQSPPSNHQHHYEHRHHQRKIEHGLTSQRIPHGLVGFHAQCGRNTALQYWEIAPRVGVIPVQCRLRVLHQNLKQAALGEQHPQFLRST